MSSQKRIVLVVVVIVAVVAIIWIASSYSHPSYTPPASQTTTNSSSSASASSNGSSTVSVQVTTSTSLGTYSSKSIQVSFADPSGWSLGPDLPISIDNFNHAYLNGDIIPTGGAEIDITSGQYKGSISALISTELSGDTQGAITSVTVDGVSCSEIPYSSTYAPGYPSGNVAVYCQDPSNGLLYKIYLSYRANDPKAAQFRSTLGQVLASMKFGV